MSDEGTQDHGLLFWVTSQDLDELANAAGLDKETPEFRRYARFLEGAIYAFRAGRSLHREGIRALREAPRRARSIAKKTAALLAEIGDLRPPHIRWLHSVRSSFDPVDLGSERSEDEEEDEEETAQLWIRHLSSELHKVRQSAEALERRTRAPRGRKPDMERILLGRYVAGVFHKCAKRRPTKGRDSGFERTLRICLAAVGRERSGARYKKDLHTLVATILDGMEFKPWEEIPFLGVKNLVRHRRLHSPVETNTDIGGRDEDDEARKRRRRSTGVRSRRPAG